MLQWFQLFLFLHILAAIVAFGPSFVFPLIASRAAAAPEHGLFSLRLTDAIETRLVIPFALTMPLSGLGIVWSLQLDLLAARWLLLAIALYVVAIGYAVAVQVPRVARMIKLAEGMQAAARGLASSPDTAPAAAGGSVQGGAGSATGPLAEMGRLGKGSQRGGMLLGTLVVAIVALMVVRPTL